jgi:hypothetical protein
MRRSAIGGLAIGAFLALTPHAGATTRPRCGVVQRSTGSWARVVVNKGHVSCVEAETVEGRLWRGEAPTACTVNAARCPFGDQVSRVDGWTCSYHGDCIRRGRTWATARDRILVVRVYSRKCEAEGAEHGAAGEEGCYDE